MKSLQSRREAGYKMPVRQLRNTEYSHLSPLTLKPRVCRVRLGGSPSGEPLLLDQDACHQPPANSGKSSFVSWSHSTLGRKERPLLVPQGSQVPLGQLILLKYYTLINIQHSGNLIMAMLLTSFLPCNSRSHGVGVGGHDLGHP